MSHFKAAFQSPCPLPRSFRPLSPRCARPGNRPTISRHIIRCELRPGTEVTGRVTNITPYGAFVDLGAYGHGLLHISQISDSFVSSVSSYLSVNDKVRVRVLSVDPGTNRIALSMKRPQPAPLTGYDRVVQLGGDWGHPWNDDGETRFIDMGPRPKGPEAWESDPTLFEEWREKCPPQSDE